MSGHLIPPGELDSLKLGADLVGLFEEDGSVMVREGPRFKTLCPFHADQSPSLSVLPDTGVWKCFACDAKGDAIKYLEMRRGLDFKAAVELLRARAGQPRSEPAPAAAAKKPKQRAGEIVMPVPDGVPHPRCVRFDQEPSDRFYFRDVTGRLLMVTARYPGKDGKDIKGIPWVWMRREGGDTWWSDAPDVSPLYGQQVLGQKPDALVVIVEGEKTRDAAQTFYPDHAVVAFRGTSAAKPGNTDWSPLSGRRCLVIPDADHQGAVAAKNILDQAAAAGFEVIGIADTAAFHAQKKGWDLADTDDQAVADQVLASCTDPAKAIERMLAQLPPPPDKKGPEAKGGKTPGEDVERSDILLATRFVKDHHTVVRYCPEAKRWHCWDGRRWCEDLDGSVLRLAQATVRKIAKEHLAEAEKWEHKAGKASDEKEQKILLATARSFQRKAEAVQIEIRIKSMLTLAKSRLEILVSASQLDKHDYLLNTPNGTIDLRDGQVLKHNPDHFITKMTGAAYDPKATSNALTAILENVTNYDDQVADYAQKVLGQSIFGHNRLERFYLWQGPGRSGKGTLMEAVKAAMGDYAMKAEFQSFIQTQGQRVRDDLDRLKEARLVLASEIEKGATLAAGVVKEMTGGDTIASRQLYGTYNEFRPRMTLHLQANDKPRVDDQDSGIWNRLVLIPCGPTVPEEKRDPAIKDNLLDPQRGGPAVLAWLVAGAIATHKSKYIPMPPAVAQATADYNHSQNPLADFLRTDVLLCKPPKPGSDDKEAIQPKQVCCTVKDFNDAYLAACERDMVPVKLRLTGHGITKRLDALGCWRGAKLIHGKTHKVWFGVTLANETHEAQTVSRRPSRADHLAVLGITEIPNHDGSGNPYTRARARASVCDFPELEQFSNRVIEEEGPKEPQQQTLDLLNLPDPGDDDEAAS